MLKVLYMLLFVVFFGFALFKFWHELTIGYIALFVGIIALFAYGLITAIRDLF